MREVLRELVAPVLERHGATRAFARLDRLGEERAALLRARGRGETRRLEALEAENTRLAITLDAAVKALPLLSPVVAVERMVRRALAHPEIGVVDSDAFGRNLASLADKIVAMWLPDVPLARVRRDLRDAGARAAAPRQGPLREDARLGWSAVDAKELFARAAAQLGDRRDPSDAACLRALAAVPPVGIAIAASAAAGALRPNLDEVEPVFRPDGMVAPARTLRNRALLLSGLRALRAAVDVAFPGVRALLDDERAAPRADGPYRRAEPEADDARGSRLAATIDHARLEDAVVEALDAALELELRSRGFYDDVFERTQLSKCMAEDDVYEPGDERRQRLDAAATRLASAHGGLLRVIHAARHHHAPSGIRDALVGALASASMEPNRPNLVHCVEAAEGLRAWCKNRPEVPKPARKVVSVLRRLARERLDALERGERVPHSGPILAVCREVAVALFHLVGSVPRDSELLLEELARPLVSRVRPRAP